MSAIGADERAVQPSMLARAEEIQSEIQQLSGRDLQLWSIGALIILVLTGGLLAILVPNVMWAQHVVRIEHSYLPQLFFGLISLILLFNIYLLGQRMTLNSTRRALIRELVLNERLESLSLIDPLTQLMNKRAVHELVPIEVARANRLGSNLTFMAIDLDGFRAINSKFGSIEGDHVLLEFSKILRTVYRGGDIVFRQGGDEFLIVMPETSEPQADYPVQRLVRLVEQWNLTHKKSYQMAFSYGLSAYVTGADYSDALRIVDRKMYQKRHNLVPVF
jgi:diguanylate cyclase (GGDEF)-like protein